MPAEVLSIRLVRSKALLEVCVKGEARYVLEPQKRIYYLLAEGIAKKQAESRRRVPAAKVVGIVAELMAHRGTLTGREKLDFGEIKDFGVFHTDWAQSFVKRGSWTVREKKGAKVVGKDAGKIRSGVFKSFGATLQYGEYSLGNPTTTEILLEGPDTPTTPISAEEKPLALSGGDIARDPACEWKRLCEYCGGLLKSTLSRLVHKYDPGLYVNRREVEEEFGRFLKSPQNLFVIGGRSGTGKTNVMCHFARTSNCPVLVFSGEFCVGRNFSLHHEIEQALRPAFAGAARTGVFVAEAHRTAQANGSTILICIDALNEFADPMDVVQQLGATASQWNVVYPCIKFCVSCRTPVRGFLRRMPGTGLPLHDLYVSTAGTKHALFPEDAPAVSLELANLNRRELATAVRTYRQRARFRGRMSHQLRELCANPLLLRLVARTYARKALPGRIDALEIWDAYWQTTVDSGPGGTGALALAIASLMRASGTTEVTEPRLADSTQYSAERLAHLISVGVVTSLERRYEQWLSFGHERLLEYALARSLWQIAAETVEALPALVKQCESFAPLENCLPMFASMLEQDLRWYFLRRLAGASTKGKKLVCAVVEALSLSSDEAWGLLESIADDEPLAVAQALGEIGDSRPEHAIRLLSRLIQGTEDWGYGDVVLYAEPLRNLCRKASPFVKAAEGFLTRSSRYKQVALITLSGIEDYAGWTALTQAIEKLAKSRDATVRRAVTSTIRDLGRRDAETARHILEQTARDSSEYVRYSVAWYLAKMVGDDPKWSDHLAALVESDDWRERQVAAIAVGHALLASDSDRLRSHGMVLAADSKNAVRFSLGWALLTARSGAFRSGLFALLEAIILRSNRSERDRLAHLCSREDVVAEVLKHWSHAEQQSLREFAARVWGLRLGGPGMDAARRFSEDSHASVRRAFAERLALGPCATKESAHEVIEVARRMLQDPDALVRLWTCKAVSRLADADRERCVSLALRVVHDNDARVKRAAIMCLLELDAAADPGVRQAIYGSLKGLRCSDQLTELGVGLGKLACGSHSARDFLRELFAYDSEPIQHVATAASLWVGLFSHDRRAANECLRGLADAIRSASCRAHIVAFTLLDGFDEREATDEYRPHLPDLETVLGAGPESGSVIVRLWAVSAAWQCVAFCPTALGQCGDRVLKHSAADREWQVRYAVALYAGQVLSMGRDMDRSTVLRIFSALVDTLVAEEIDLVRQALAFTLAQLTERERGDLFESLETRPEVTEIRSMIPLYTTGTAEEHFLGLAARYYCDDFARVRDELQFEIESLGGDWAGLVLALWRERADETEALVEEWRSHPSSNLRKTAREFTRRRGTPQGKH